MLNHLTVLFTALAITPAVSAQLVGSGAHLPLPSPIQVPQPGVAPTLGNINHPTSFEGTWSAPVQTGWQGTFTASGPVPNNTNLGTTRYDFSTLNAGHLPAGTFFNFGDVDLGSGQNETFTLQAFDSSGGIITTPWLSLPAYTWGFGRNAGDPDLLDMPGWSWTASTGTYFIDGTTVTGFNPSITVTMLSLFDISELAVVKSSIPNGFSITAPIVPAPGALAVLGLAGLATGRRRR